MSKYFVAGSNVFGGFAYFSAKNAKQLKALRLKKGERVIVHTDGGTEYALKVNGGKRKNYCAGIENTQAASAMPTIKCRIFAAYQQKERCDNIVRNAAELGAAEIAFFPSTKCKHIPDEKEKIRLAEHWKRFVQDTAVRLHSTKVPKILLLSGFEQAIEQASASELPLMLYEGECEKTLKEVLCGGTGFRDAAIVTGGENGFTREERDYAASRGLLCISMGPRVLMSDTAPICALSAVMAFTDNL